MKKLAILVGIVHAVACMASILTLLMLHADGAYFVYVIGTGDPWGMKWREIVARVTIYLFTVVPTQFMTELLHLSPIGIAKWNAFFFYGIQLLLYAISCVLIWKSQPRFLVFPVLQFALSTSLGFGFPSEILLSPGFLWICLFLVMKGRAASIYFLLSFLALLFTHELVLPAALVCVYLAVKSISEKNPEKPVMVLVQSLPIIGAVFLLFGVRIIYGGVGADPNAIYVFDPRRILNNPTLWVLAPALTIVGVTSFFLKRISLILIFAVVLAAMAAPFLLQYLAPSISFEQGRYDSARTIVGGSMFVLAIAFATVVRSPRRTQATKDIQFERAIPLLVIASIAINISTAGMFLRDWVTGLHALDRAVSESPLAEKPEFVSIEKAGSLFTPSEINSINRLHFPWALTFRSVILADGEMPKRVLYGSRRISFMCDRGEVVPAREHPIPLRVSGAVMHFNCDNPPPPDEPLTFRARLQRALDRMMGNTSSAD